MKKPHARRQFFFAPHEIDVIRSSLTYLHEQLNEANYGGPAGSVGRRFTQRQVNEVLKQFNPFFDIAKKDAA